MKVKELVTIKKELNKGRLKFFQFQIKTRKAAVFFYWKILIFQYFTFKEGDLCL